MPFTPYVEVVYSLIKFSLLIDMIHCQHDRNELELWLIDRNQFGKCTYSSRRLGLLRQYKCFMFLYLNFVYVVTININCIR